MAQTPQKLTAFGLGELGRSSHVGELVKRSARQSMRVGFVGELVNVGPTHARIVLVQPLTGHGGALGGHSDLRLLPRAGSLVVPV